MSDSDMFIVVIFVINSIKVIRMNEKMLVNITSEFGKLEGVIIHTPGLEVEEMTPETAKRALYSDILNLSVAQHEYMQFKGVLTKTAQCFEVTELLANVLSNEQVKEKLLTEVCNRENVTGILPKLINIPAKKLSQMLIQGVPIVRDNLTRYLSHERFSLSPLHNFFFTRDASMAFGDEVIIAKMANKIRDRESLIMDTIFSHHPIIAAQTVKPAASDKLSIEGGDFQVARKDVLIMGTGIRTTSQGIDFILERIKVRTKGTKHIIIQELPDLPESFIHLDMVFTLLDYDTCMVYEPLILGTNRFRTIHIHLEDSEVKSIKEEDNLLKALKNVGIEMNPVSCGGKKDAWIQEREQWHSGANFLAIAPGQIIGYERNVYTIEELDKNGFEVIDAQDILDGKNAIPESKKCVITIAGSELARGGGGARCMSMPFKRRDIQ